MGSSHRNKHRARLILRQAAQGAPGTITEFEWDSCEVEFTSKLALPEIAGVEMIVASSEPSTPRHMADPEVLNRSVNTLDLSTRASTGLMTAGIRTIGELAARQPYDLLKVRGVGETVLQEYDSALAALGLYLGMPLD